MSERKPKRPQSTPELESLLEQEEPEATTFTQIGGSPVPGLTLRQVLRGHTSTINRIAWSPDGCYLASTSADKTIRVWDVVRGECTAVLAGHTGRVNSVVWTPDSDYLISGSHDRTLRRWDIVSGTGEKLFTSPQEIWSVGQSQSGSIVAFGGFVNKVGPPAPIHFFNVEKKEIIRSSEFHTTAIYDIEWSPDGALVASVDHDGNIAIWDGETLELAGKRRRYSTYIFDMAWSQNNRSIAIGLGGGTVRILDFKSWKETHVLEGHKGKVTSVSFSSDGRILASKATVDGIRLWDAGNGKFALLGAINEVGAGGDMQGMAFHPKKAVLATLCETDTAIRIWELDEAILIGQAQESVHYTTAKLVLVGDSGVGKTGLGWRLAHGEFREHSSTHGQQFWPIKQLGLKRKDGTECEAVLWDLAGQHAYRQIHSIFLDNVAAALVLFDPSNRQEPLKGVQFWLEQLRGKGQLPPVVLVGARVDVSPPALSQQDFDQFCQRYGVRGGYISTSAKRGEGLEELLERLKAQIPWDEMTATVTTVTFKRIKDYVLALKEKPDRKGVLVSPAALREQLQASDRDWRFTDAEMMTAVGHLETHGYVAVLRSSAGEEHILLAPDLLVTLASSIVFLADKNPRELGAVSETELLQGRHQFDELAGLAPAESQVLLDAAILRFLQHSICFRETLGDETLLIFPALIKQKRPLQDDLPSADDISYVVRGRVENLYASLVVLLGYTPSFTRINQWQNQAQYEMGEGEVCGFRLIQDREGEIELVLYYGDRMPADGRAKFQELFEQFLYQRDVDVTRFPPVVCPQGHQQERTTVIKRSREGKTFAFCDECGRRTELPDFGQPQTIGTGASLWLQREEAVARLRSTYEVQLTRVKSYRRAWSMPRCYVSHLPEQSAWAEKLVHDLRDAGVYVVEQAAQTQPDDFVILLDTPDYSRAYQHSALALAADTPLVRARLGTRQLISLALTGGGGAHELKDCTPGSFCDVTHYPVSLFDLVLNLYAIPFAHAGFAPLRHALHRQWEQTLAGKKGDDATSPLKIFVSYSHNDKAFKDELVTMLAGLERRGVVDAWHDRRIEAGDEWYKSIEDAMDSCDLALLLVSPDYLASRFIQDEEQPRLLQRRREMQLRVIPIIARPCTWQSEPVLKDLQALPGEGRAVITFSKDNGERDQVWADIAAVIEKRAKAKSTA